MIERFLRRSRVRQRFERGPLASVAEAFVAHLVVRGYSKLTAQTYLQAAAHFGLWLRRSGRTLGQVDTSTVDVFLTRHLPHCRCPAPRSRTTHVVRAALRQLVAVLRITRALTEVPPPSPADAVIANFERHLVETCGAAPATRHYYRREARDLLVARFGTGPIHLEALTPMDVRAFVTTRARVLSPASTNVVGTAIRSFLRYLRLQGCGASETTFAVPRAAAWRLCCRAS